MIDFKLVEEMRSDVINMSRAWDTRNPSPQQELNLWPYVYRSDDLLTTELRSTRGELGQIQGSCMTSVLRTARISNFESSCV